MANPSFREVRKFLNSCVFNPKKPGPMLIIAEVQDFSYFQNRAIEFIRTIDDTNYEENIRRAIQLLALAEHLHKEI